MEKQEIENSLIHGLVFLSIFRFVRCSAVQYGTVWCGTLYNCANSAICCATAMTTETKKKEVDTMYFSIAHNGNAVRNKKLIRIVNMRIINKNN